MSLHWCKSEQGCTVFVLALGGAERTKTYWEGLEGTVRSRAAELGVPSDLVADNWELKSCSQHDRHKDACSDPPYQSESHYRFQERFVIHYYRY
jgi:hypothetical protein